MEKKLASLEKGDEKVARQALPWMEAAGAVAASVGQEEGQGRKGGVIRNSRSSAMCGAERPRRGRQSAEGKKAQEKSKRKKKKRT